MLKTNAVKTLSNPVYDITPFTLIDYPDKTACIIWFAGCNMRCSYCYNPDIVFGKGKMSFDEVFSFLEKRKNLLDAVVLSGGECTMHRHLKEFVYKIKALGYLIKIDTNGSNPAILKTLIQEGLIDYVSLDFKAPSFKFHAVTGSYLFEKFSQSLSILNTSGIPFEVRTTYHSVLLNKNDLNNMMDYLLSNNYSNHFYIQEAVNSATTIDNLPSSVKNLDKNFVESAPLKVIIRN